jgi:hypothetical protein
MNNFNENSLLEMAMLNIHSKSRAIKNKIAGSNSFGIGIPCLQRHRDLF